MHNYGVYEAFNQNAGNYCPFLEFRRQLGIKLLSSHKYYRKKKLHDNDDYKTFYQN